MRLSQAVLSLREHAGESQRAFARTLGMSFFALQKYEQGGPQTPDPRLLVAFWSSAIHHSRPDLSAVFDRELIAAMDPPAGFSVEVTVKRTRGKRP
jgi:hypothetical protein